MRRKVYGALAAACLAVALVLAVRSCGEEGTREPPALPRPPASRADPRVHAQSPASEPAAQESGPAPAAASPAPGVTPTTRKLCVRVLDSSGAPVAAASIVVHDQFAQFDYRTVLAEATSDAEGFARFTLPSGDWIVHAWARGEAAVLGSEKFGELGRARTLDDGATTIDVRLGLVTRVRGVVRFADGTPVAAAAVTGAFQTAPLTHWTFYAHATTGPDGRFEFEALPRPQFGREAEVKVARGPGHWSATAKFRPEDAEAGEVDLIVERSCRLSGRCVDRPGAVVAGALVQFYGERWNTGGGTDKSGRFAFDVPRGDGWVEVGADGFVRLRKDGVHATGAEHDVGDILLERP